MNDFRARKCRYPYTDSETDEIKASGYLQHPHRSHATMMWVGIGTAVLGAGTSIYGADQQRKASHAATDANTAQQDSQNAATWTAWLMSRGVQPTSPVDYGVVPTAANSKAVNARLPLWATITPRAPAGARFRRIGSGTTMTAASTANNPGAAPGNSALRINPLPASFGGGSAYPLR